MTISLVQKQTYSPKEPIISNERRAESVNQPEFFHFNASNWNLEQDTESYQKLTYSIGNKVRAIIEIQIWELIGATFDDIKVDPKHKENILVTGSGSLNGHKFKWHSYVVDKERVDHYFFPSKTLLYQVTSKIDSTFYKKCFPIFQKVLTSISS